MAKEKDSKKEVTSTEKSANMPRVASSRVLSPFDEMERRMELMERAFDDFFPSPWRRGFGFPSLWGKSLLADEWAPKADIIDRENEIVVRAELPGVEKNDLDLTVTENTVTLKGETKKESKEEKGDFYRCETSRGSFVRTFALPCDVDGSKSKAEFKNGILELTLPKVAKSKRHNVKIS